MAGLRRPHQQVRSGDPACIGQLEPLLKRLREAGLPAQ
jgi:hypothetical protein